MDHAVLYEQFSNARSEAMALTDRYHQADHADPNRDSLWQDVVVQTETARRLLDSWLQAGTEPEDPDEQPAPPRPLVTAR